MSNPFAKALENLEKAAKADRDKQYQVALDLYEKGVVQLRQVLQEFPPPEKRRQQFQANIDKYVSRAEELKKRLRKTETEGQGTDGSLPGHVCTEKPDVTFTDVIGYDGVKDCLKNEILKPLKNLKSSGAKDLQWPLKVLLYGAPGSGKTYLVKALMAEVDGAARLMYASASNWMTNRLGDTAREVRNLFESALAHKPSLVVIDDIDLVCPSPEVAKNDNLERVYTELMVQIEGVAEDSEGLVVIATTSKPLKLKEEFYNLFTQKLYVGLPTLQDREMMIRKQLSSVKHDLNDQNFTEASERTAGYTGADIMVLVKDVMMQPIRKLQKATHFKKVKGPCKDDPSREVDDLLTPCGPDDPDAIQIDWTLINANKLLEPIVCWDDFINSLQTSKPSLSEDDIQLFLKFKADTAT